MPPPSRNQRAPTAGDTPAAAAASSLDNPSEIASQNRWLSPVYWVLMSVAAWKGLLQLFYRPFYWEKTVHGLSSVAGLEAADAIGGGDAPRPDAR